MELNERILELRKKRGMTQDELAEALLVSRQTIYKWETGRALPDVNRLRQICELFGISADELLDISLSGGNSGDVRDSAPDSNTPMTEAALQTETVLPSEAIPPTKAKKKLIVLLCASVAVIALCALLLLCKPAEVRSAIALGIVPAGMESGAAQPVTERELWSLLSNVCEKETGEVPESLAAAILSATKERLTREKAAYMLYCAHVWTRIDSKADMLIKADTPSPIVMRSVYDDLNDMSRKAVDALDGAYEDTLCRELAEVNELYAELGGTSESEARMNAILHGNYITSVTFCLAQRSYADEKPLMEAADGLFRPKELLTREEAIIAAYRLYGSW